MNELLTLQMDGFARGNLQCPIGKRLRVLSISATLAPATALDQCLVEFKRSGIVVCTVATNPMALSMVLLSATIGGQSNRPMVVQTVVASGVHNYDVQATVVTCALPDVWWPWDVSVAVTMASGAGTTAGTVVYERADD